MVLFGKTKSCGVQRRLRDLNHILQNLAILLKIIEIIGLSMALLYFNYLNLGRIQYKCRFKTGISGSFSEITDRFTWIYVIILSWIDLTFIWFSWYSILTIQNADSLMRNWRYISDLRDGKTSSNSEDYFYDREVLQFCNNLYFMFVDVRIRWSITYSYVLCGQLQGSVHTHVVDRRDLKQSKGH